MNSPQDKDITVADFFHVIWTGRKAITLFIFGALIIGGSYIFLKDPYYESTASFSINLVPPTQNYEIKKNKIKIDIDKIKYDFENILYSKNIFNEWKDFNKNASISYDDFTNTIKIDDILFTKEDDEKLIEFVSTRIGKNYFIIKSGNILHLNDYHSYLEYINDSLTQKYLTIVKAELRMLENLDNKDNYKTEAYVQYVLLNEKFITSVTQGERVFSINRPSAPIMKSPNVKLIIILSILLGGLIGSIYVLNRQ